MNRERNRRAITLPRLRGRPKVVPDEVQRAAVILQAREMFIEEGYARTTTDKVAARCKISKRTLYRLFSSKEDLLAAVVDAHRQSMLDLPGNRDDLPLTDALEAIFIIDIDAEADRERVAFLRFALLESAQFPEIDTLVRQRGPEMALALLADWFAHQRTLGRIEIDDVDSAARMLMDMIFGAVVVKTMGELEWPGGDERKTYIRRCIRVFVNGIRSR